MCEGEPMPILAPVPPTAPGESSPPIPTLECASNFGIVSAETAGQPAIDQGPNIRVALDALKRRRSGLFLPRGTYGFKGDLVLPGGTALVGSSSRKTRLKNLDKRGGTLSTTKGASKGVRIEGLQLHNTRIVLRSMSPSAVRWNGLTGTNGKKAQITVVRGPHAIDGNVLWRSKGRPGFGIDIGRDDDVQQRKDMPHAHFAKAPQVTIVNNLIGTVDARDLSGFGYQPEFPTVDMARVMMSDADSNEYRGNYQTAIRSMIPVPLKIKHNIVILDQPVSLTPAPAESPRAVADFQSPRNLSLVNNTFRGWGANQGLAASIRLRSPSQVTIDNNFLRDVPMMLERDPGDTSPAKLIGILNNVFTRSPLRIDIAVNGAGSEHTAPEDISIRSNFFYENPGCPVFLRKAAVGSSNFDVALNMTFDDDGHEVATQVCDL